MPIEIVIYLAIGLCVSGCLLAWAYFVENEINMDDLIVALLMIIAWPLGITTWLILLLGEAKERNFVIVRRRKNGRSH